MTFYTRDDIYDYKATAPIAVCSHWKSNINIQDEITDKSG